MNLVSVPLDGMNFLTWSRAIKLALGAKQKLGFIDGTCTKPEENKSEIEPWERVDCMVVSWLLNSITKDIAEPFLYTTSAQDLWEQLEARFGETNGPMLKIVEMNTSGQLIQFLMGLEESCDHIRSQILLMEPLPTIGKVYSMLLWVEKQWTIYVGTAHNGAMKVRSFSMKRQVSNEERQKGKGPLDKRSQHCDHCKRSGHTRETCFLLKGFPNWYKTLLEQRKMEKTSANKAYNVNAEERLQGPIPDMGANFSDLIRMEIRKVMQEHDFTREHVTNSANLEDFASNTSTITNVYIHSPKPWIIDSGASTHMCCDFKSVKRYKRLKTPTYIKLPDGTKREVIYKGIIQLYKEINLNEVLYVPSFKHNFLSVSKMCHDNPLRVSFTNNECLIQDSQTMKAIALSKLVG
ncbi:UNVERIFIED_CONTAM: hypothetical protein Sindi_1478600 [Sesamum indicum]